MKHRFLNFSLNCKGKLVNISRPGIMGIINITPDSFYAGSRFQKKELIIEKVKQFILEGASFIDIGAFSSRPGAMIPDEKTEWERLLPALEVISDNFPDFIFSLDTFRSSIAERAVKNYNISIINDISAGNLDTLMFKTVGKLNVPYVVMHMKGTPQTMQIKPFYENIISELFDYFHEKVKLLYNEGVCDIILDPGFGFGKTIEHNFILLQQLEKFQIFNLPILVGLSRKATIYKTLNITPEESLNGTTFMNTIALNKGASILRVHDVKPACEIVKLYEAYIKNN